jgi:hypothetical protein
MMIKLLCASILMTTLILSVNARGITEDNIDDYIILPLGHTIESREVRGPFTLEHDLHIAFDIIKALCLKIGDMVDMTDKAITEKAMEIVASKSVCWLGLRHMPDEGVRKIFIGRLATDYFIEKKELTGALVIETLREVYLFTSAGIRDR